MGDETKNEMDVDTARHLLSSYRLASPCSRCGKMVTDDDVAARRTESHGFSVTPIIVHVLCRACANEARAVVGLPAEYKE